MPQQIVGTILLIHEKHIFICSCIYPFLFFFFTINNEHNQKCFFKKFVLTVSILKIMKAFVLVEQLSTTGF